MNPCPLLQLMTLSHVPYMPETMICLSYYNQAKLQSFSTAPKFKYGYEIPCNYTHAVELDRCNDNTKWADTTALELRLMEKYNVFKDCGLGAPIPPG